jgi:polar amino acid transport system permease protein
VITPFTAAILGLGLNAAAYMSETVRAGIQSIHHGQAEAAQALGLSKSQTLFSILLPQAMRVIVPPASNEIISMLKYSSMVSVIAVPELLYSAQLIYARNFETIPLLIVASIWYLLVTTVLTIGQHYLEKRYARGVRVNSRVRLSEPAPGGEALYLPEPVAGTLTPEPAGNLVGGTGELR